MLVSQIPNVTEAGTAIPSIVVERQTTLRIGTRSLVAFAYTTLTDRTTGNSLLASGRQSGGSGVTIHVASFTSSCSKARLTVVAKVYTADGCPLRASGVRIPKPTAERVVLPVPLSGVIPVPRLARPSLAQGAVARRLLVVAKRPVAVAAPVVLLLPLQGLLVRVALTRAEAVHTVLRLLGAMQAVRIVTKKPQATVQVLRRTRLGLHGELSQPM